MNVHLSVTMFLSKTAVLRLELILTTEGFCCDIALTFVVLREIFLTALIFNSLTRACSLTRN